MSRIRVVAAHAFALPVALGASLILGSLLATLPGGTAVDIPLNDTMFVIAHFHVATVLAPLLVAVAVLARHYGTSGMALRWAWLFLCLHLAFAGYLWLFGQLAVDTPGIAFVAVPPSVGILYVATAVFATGLVFTAWFISVIRACSHRAAPTPPVHPVFP